MDREGLLACDWTQGETALYALAIGLGADPLDPRTLPFVQERGQTVLPSFAATLAGRCGLAVDWGDAEIDPRTLLHVGQKTWWRRPLTPEGRLLARSMDSRVEDRGASVELVTGIELLQESDGQPVARVEAAGRALRKAGPTRESVPDAPRPAAPASGRPADVSIDLPTRSDAALLYRLLGDANPIHSWPDAAQAVGLAQPILHGLATYGVVCHGVLAACADLRPERLASLEGRFSAPVYPGDTITLELWRADTRAWDFIARVRARGVVVMKAGRAELQD